MPNINAPFGLLPINANGTPYTGQLSLYNIPAAVVSNVFIGDPVIPLVGGSDAFGVPTVTLATAGGANFLIGSVVSIVNGPAAGANATVPVTRDLPTYHPASTNGYVLVADDPNTLFAIMEDSVGGAIPITDVSENFSLVAGAGNTTTGLSGWMLDSSVHNTTTLQMRLMRLLRKPDNAVGVNAVWVTRINQHSLWNPVGI